MNVSVIFVPAVKLGGDNNGEYSMKTLFLHPSLVVAANRVAGTQAAAIQPKFEVWN